MAALSSRWRQNDGQESARFAAEVDVARGVDEIDEVAPLRLVLVGGACQGAPGPRHIQQRDGAGLHGYAPCLTARAMHDCDKVLCDAFCLCVCLPPGCRV